MFEQQPFANRVHMRTLPAFSVERIADLDTIDVGDDVVITGASDDRAGSKLANRPGQHVSGLLTGEGVCNVGRYIVRSRNPRVPQFPQTAIHDGGLKCLAMTGRQRLQPHAVTFERNRRKFNH